MDNDLLTTAEAATYLKRSHRWIQDIILRGKLKAEKVGSFYVVRLSDVKRYKHQARGSGRRTKTAPSKSGQRNGNR